MSGFGYASLREEGVSTSNQPLEHGNNNIDSNRHVQHGIQNHDAAASGRTRLSNESELKSPGDYEQNDRRVVSPSKAKNHNPYHPRPSDTARGSSTKYTALRPTSVREIVLDSDIPEASLPGSYSDESEPEDLNFYESQIEVNLIRSPLLHRISRFHVILCGLLLAAVAVVGFGVLYVFVILPSHKGTILSPGGKPPTADIIKLKHLGNNVAVTSCGLVRGTFENGAHVFRGIPYAAAPTGQLRWKAPVPRSYDAGTCWQDVLNTTSFASACAQPVVSVSDDGENRDTHKVNKRSHPTLITGSEDCLYLNVWTPSLNPPEPLPVLVWIHSGDFVHGSGHATAMTPTAELATSTNAVYVSFNYRLGVFGFLALDALREKSGLPFAATGNYGIMDQQLALQWVKDNARNFGGDYKKVTVFGHGSGATSIQALLMSPSSSGLFNAAWLTSPAALLNKTLDKACQDNQPLMTRSGCSSAHCLRQLDTATLIRLSPWSLDPRWTLDRLLDTPNHTQLRNDLAIFDGHVIHWDSMRHGPTGPTVPVVIGATYSDLGGLSTTVPVTNLTWDQLDTVLVHELSSLGTEAVLQIKSRYSQMSKAGYSVLSSPMPANDGFFPLPSRQFARLVRDIQAVCPSKILADELNALFAQSAPIYLYISEAFPSQELRRQKPTSELPTSLALADDLFMGWDMVAFFGSFRELGFRKQQSDISFQDILRQELLSVARTGKPNAARWHTEGMNTGLLRAEVTVSPAPANYFDSCDILRQFGFFHYTWINSA